MARDRDDEWDDGPPRRAAARPNRVPLLIVADAVGLIGLIGTGAVLVYFSMPPGVREVGDEPGELAEVIRVAFFEPPPTTAPTPPATPTVTKTVGPYSPVALTVKDLGEYDVADTAGRKRMVEAGVVVVSKDPTKVVYETTVKGNAYVRPADGLFKGRLVVVDAADVM